MKNKEKLIKFIQSNRFKNKLEKKITLANELIAELKRKMKLPKNWRWIKIDI